MTTIGAGEQPLELCPEPIEHELATARHQSALRYPGAKTWLAPTVGEILEAAKSSRQMSEIDLLVEPFAGGASVSLRMVGRGIVQRILLADADPMVAAYWQAAAEDAPALIDRLRTEWSKYVSKGGHVAVDRWDHWRSLEADGTKSDHEQRLQLAVKCLFLNRTTFSGILHGKAGPIGGRAQASEYDIGCRWNQESLESRIEFVAELYDAGRLVDVWRKDWQQTLDDVPEFYPQLIPRKVVSYIDPPYLEKSALLYRTSFDPNGGYSAPGEQHAEVSRESLHVTLANYLRSKAQFRWLLSYDHDQSLVEDSDLYAGARMSPSREDHDELGAGQWAISKRLVATKYSASGKNGKRSADELLITTLPPSSLDANERLRPIGR